MTESDFRTLVAEMRHAQKEFFRTRSDSTMEQAKNAEKKVDKALSEGVQDQKQKRLFASE